MAPLASEVYEKSKIRSNYKDYFNPFELELIGKDDNITTERN
jgi:hypothetical protein